ncbi:MAG: magnesium/cobalt transporter CorA [Jatrophihabitantaceae bacterium]
MPNVPRPRTLVPGRLVPGRRQRGGHLAAPEHDPRSAIVDCAIYRDGCRDPEDMDWRAAIDEVDRTGQGFVWIGLHEPDEAQFAGIADRFGLHPLAVEDVIHAHQRPKLEAYENTLFAVVKTVHYDDTLPGGKAEVVETGEVMVFLGLNFVITVRHGEHGGLHAVRMRLEADPALLCLGPSAVLHAVMDSIVDSYVVVCRALQEDVDEAETAVFTESSRITDSNVIYVLKREVLELRRSTAPLAPVLRRLTQGELEQIEPRVRDYFRDVDDHLNEVVDRVNGFDELLTTLVSANLARVSVVQNEDMRKISAWVAIAAVPTLLAGIYGMNFDHMPELHWLFGYPLLLIVMVSFCSLLYRAFKRNGWL